MRRPLKLPGLADAWAASTVFARLAVQLLPCSAGSGHTALHHMTAHHTTLDIVAAGTAWTTS